MGLIMRQSIYGLLLLVLSCVCASCVHRNSDNSGQLQSYPAPLIESGWIRNGEPIVLEKEKWYPMRDVEDLTDAEVYQIGEYKNVQIFVDKVDVKPYQRIYTKFAKNKFRYFMRKTND